ncbi:carboxymuconolactone decarboxylase family protein [Phenylobacterium sp. LjRoot219]|uniref:carboxymuconolactone decarboxylase family protein n=1 Tax=Phenylobacterium sp. LjRoot219 TaxID=3342283 RepID=UPI003ECD9DEB
MAQTAERTDIEEREALILGKPPRVAPPAEITDEMRAMCTSPRGYAIHGVLPANYAILLHTPEFLRHYRPLGNHLLVDGVLAPRDRELAILRVGWLSKVPYVWGEHVTIGKKCGLTSADIERVIEGSAAAGWTDHERAILAAVEELLADALISDPTWEVLARTLEQAQLVELPMLIGYYQQLAFFMNSLRVPLRAANPGLSAR